MYRGNSLWEDHFILQDFFHHLATYTDTGGAHTLPTD